MPRPHREIASSSKVNVAGACAGATTLAALLGYYAASSDQSPVNCATMLVAVLDTEVESTMLLFATQDTIRSMHVDRSELNRRLRASGGHGYYLQLLATVGWTSVLWLPALRPQTLIMMGADDPIVPVVNGRLLATLVPRAPGHDRGWAPLSRHERARVRADRGGFLDRPIKLAGQRRRGRRGFGLPAVAKMPFTARICKRSAEDRKNDDHRS